MEWVETTGRTIEEAKDSALDELGVDEQEAEFDIVEEPKLGLFGRVRGEARVRARIRPTSPRSKDNGRDRRRRRSSAASQDVGTEAAAPESAAGSAEAPGQGAPSGARPARATAGRSTPPAETPPDQPPSKLRRSSRGSTTMDTTPDDTTSDSSTGEDAVPLLEQARIGAEFLTGLLEAFALAGDVEVRQRATAEGAEEVVDLIVSGTDLGLLIGPQGGTLNAIQEITRTVVQRRTGGRNGRLLIDVGGYRAKRAEALERFVRQVAEQVKSTGTRLALEPMHAADRKVVHDTVNTIDGVSTVSEGEEPRRRVVLEPFGG